MVSMVVEESSASDPSRLAPLVQLHGNEVKELDVDAVDVPASRKEVVRRRLVVEHGYGACLIGVLEAGAREED